MNSEIPDKAFGKPVKGAMKRVFEKLEKEKSSKKQTNQESQTQTPKDGFIYVPSINLHVAKERSLLNLNWNETHEELYKENLRMPTIPEFIAFIKYLKTDSNNEEYKQILDDILTVREPWRSQWLDAKFSKTGRDWQISYNHTIDNGNLISRNHEKLEKCLRKDKTPGIDLEYWLNNVTSQGLPPTNTPNGDLWYWHPRENTVTGFDADSDGAYLYCNRRPDGRDGRLGVFSCAEGMPPKQNLPKNDADIGSGVIL